MKKIAFIAALIALIGAGDLGDGSMVSDLDGIYLHLPSVGGDCHRTKHTKEPITLKSHGSFHRLQYDTKRKL